MSTYRAGIEMLKQAIVPIAVTAGLIGLAFERSHDSDHTAGPASTYLIHLLSGETGVLPGGAELSRVDTDPDVDSAKSGFRFKPIDLGVQVREVREQLDFQKTRGECGLASISMSLVPVYTDIDKKPYIANGFSYDDEKRTLVSVDGMFAKNVLPFGGHVLDLFYGFYGGQRHNLPADLTMVEPETPNYYNVTIPLPPEIPAPNYPIC